MKFVTGELPTILRIVIPGEPVPKGRARHRIVFPRDGGRPFVHEYTPDETAAYEKKVKILAQVAVNQAKWTTHPDDRFQILVTIYRRHWDKGGDASNIFKAIEDGMNGVVYGDDRYVRGIGIAIADPDPSNPRAEVEVRRYRISKKKR